MPDIPKRRVLVVDDNVDIAVSMAMLLEALGQKVEVATSGIEALAKAVLADVAAGEPSAGLDPSTAELLKRLMV